MGTLSPLTRGRPLLERRIISEKTFDDRENLVRDAQAAVKVAEAKVKTAELDVFFTRITSPLTGRISRNQVSIGNWVSAGGTSSSTLLSTIVSQDPIHIYFDVNENNYIKYKRLSERGAWRFRVESGLVRWQDRRLGPQEQDVDMMPLRN